MAEPLQFLIKSAFDATGITAATNSVRSIDSQINRVSSGFNKLMGLMGAGGIGAALFSFGKSSVMEFSKSEAGVAKLSKALQNLGTFTAADVEIQTDFAKQLQLTTKYSDEDIMAIQTQLVTYGLYGEKLKQATQATLDLATKTGSTESASKLLGKAFQGQTDTLSRYGIKIDASITGAAKFDAVLSQVQARLGGMAAVEGATFEGQLARMSNRFDELKERIGKELMPVANAWLGWLEKATTATENLFSKETKELKGIDLTIAGLKARAKFTRECMQLQEDLGTTATDTYIEQTKTLNSITDALKRMEAQKAKGGKIVAGRPTLSVINPDSAEEIKAQKLQQSEAIKNDKEYARESEKITEQITDIEGFALTERGQMYTRYFGKMDMDRRRDQALQGITSKQLQIKNKQMLLDLERDYEAASHTISGGFKQAMDEMNQAGLNWKQGFDQVVSSSMGPATEAFKVFFNESTKGFLNMSKLAEGVFRGIRDAFYQMVMQMLAKWALLNLLGLVSGTGGVNFFSTAPSRASGGPVPGSEGSPVPMLAHGGEFVLSANVVKAIKAGQTTSGLSGGSAAASGGAATINQTINVNGGLSSGDIGETLRQIAEAGRRGTTAALDAAKVLYKQGAKRSGETAL